MAARNISASMSAELMQKLHPYGYKNYVAILHEGDCISQEFFRASKWVNYFALDTSLTFRNGKVNPDHVYELFGSFNGLSSREVRSYLLGYVCKNVDFFDGRGSVCLPMRGLDLSSWVDNLDDCKVCCDKLALLGLSAMYQRHTLVVTKNKFWSTIESSEPLSIIDLMKACSVRLLYLGNMKFGTLRWQPRNPQPVQTKPNLGKFDIVEEITLDDHSGESSTAETNGVPHVETEKKLNNDTHDDQSSPLPAKQSETEEANIDAESPPPVETREKNVVAGNLPPEAKPTISSSPFPAKQNDTVEVNVEAESPVETREKLSLEAMPTKKEAILWINRLSAVDINVWTDMVHKYYEFVPSPVETVKITNV